MKKHNLSDMLWAAFGGVFVGSGIAHVADGDSLNSSSGLLILLGMMMIALACAAASAD